MLKTCTLLLGILVLGLSSGCNGPKYAIQGETTVQIEPQTVTLTAGRDMAFGHNITSPFSSQVTWSVAEPGGGTVDTQGRYQAPAKPGVYHVQVASITSPPRMAVAEVTIVAPPEGSLSAPDTAEPEASGLVASVPLDPGLSYTWTIQGGVLQSGSTTNQIRFSMGEGPQAVLGCRIVNAAGDAISLIHEVRRLDPIVFRPDPPSATLSVGGTIHFGYFLSRGTRSSVQWSVPNASHGQVDPNGNYRAPDTPGRYVVHAALEAAPKAAATIEVNVVPRPFGAITGPYKVKPGARGLKARVTVHNTVTIEWKITGGQIDGPADGKVVSFRSGRGPVVLLNCTLTNEAGDTFTTAQRIVVE